MIYSCSQCNNPVTPYWDSYELKPEDYKNILCVDCYSSALTKAIDKFNATGGSHGGLLVEV